MKSLWMSRRRLLLSVAALLAPSALAGIPWSESSWLRRTAVEMLLSDITGARQIGAAYLATIPEEHDAADLACTLFPGVQDIPCAPAEVVALREDLRRRRAREFATGDTVIVDGWILARTEARLCALAVLA